MGSKSRVFCSAEAFMVTTPERLESTFRPNTQTDYATSTSLATDTTYIDQTYIDHMIASLAVAGEKVVVRHHNFNVTGADLLASIYRYARALSKLNIGRGKLVALFAPNCPEAIVVRYAANLIGAATVYLPILSSPDRQEEILAGMAPDLLVLFPETEKLMPSHRHIPVVSVGLDIAADVIRLDLTAASQCCLALESAARAEDLAVVISSGGTTGVPKGSCRSFAAYTNLVDGPAASDRRQLINGHLAYLSQVLVDMTLLGGGCVVFRPSFDAADTLATIQAERITDLFLVEPQLFELMDHPDIARKDLSTLRTLNHIGASAPPTLRLRAREKLGCVLAHTYGASEVGLVSVLTPAEHDLSRPQVFSSAGRIRNNVEVRFRREDGSLGQPGQIGTIEVRSPAMAQGYRNRPDLDAEHFKDGWYLSGDMGYLDVEGYIRVLGRATDIRWIDGVLLSPTLIEEVLCQMADIREASVLADTESGKWIAGVVPWPGRQIDPSCVLAVLGRYSIKATEALVVKPIASIPLTEQGKPDRETLRKLPTLSRTRCVPPPTACARERDGYTWQTS